MTEKIVEKVKIRRKLPRWRYHIQFQHSSGEKWSRDGAVRARDFDSAIETVFDSAMNDHELPEWDPLEVVLMELFVSREVV